MWRNIKELCVLHRPIHVSMCKMCVVHPSERFQAEFGDICIICVIFHNMLNMHNMHNLHNLHNMHNMQNMHNMHNMHKILYSNNLISGYKTFHKL